MATKTKPRKSTKRKQLRPEYQWLATMRKLLAIRGGWGKGTYRNGNSFCLIGAKLAADGNAGAYERAPAAAAELATVLKIPAKVGLEFSSVSEWNDATRRTKKQVIAKIDKAIKRLSK